MVASDSGGLDSGMEDLEAVGMDFLRALYRTHWRGKTPPGGVIYTHLIIL